MLVNIRFHMDIVRLRYFYILAKTSHMRKAAELLGLSPPALSKAIRLLEEEMGYALIQADGRGLLITDKGKRLAERSEPILRAIDDLGREPVVRGELAPVRLGTFEVFSTYFWGESMERFTPQRTQMLYELIPGQIEEELAKQRIDLGITYIPIPHSGVEHIKVADIEMGIFSSTKPKYVAKTFEDIPFAVPVTPLFGTPNKVQGLDGWPEDRLPRYSKYKVTLMQSCIELVQRGLAVAYLPTFIARLHNQSCADHCRIKRVEAPAKLGSGKQGVYLVKRKSEEESPTFKSYAKALRLITKGN